MHGTPSIRAASLFRFSSQTLVLCLVYADAAFRHLLSFPTRRSSDLTRSGVCMPSLSMLHVPFSRISCAKRLVAVIAALVKPDPDRKSTRLNSSHLVISYAVFCLKKKRKTFITITDTNLTETTESNQS